MGLLLLLFSESALSSPSPAAAERRSRATTQYHTQDPSSGAYQYGYTGPHHAKSESSANGITRGGKLHTYIYVIRAHAAGVARLVMLCCAILTTRADFFPSPRDNEQSLFSAVCDGRGSARVVAAAVGVIYGAVAGLLDNGFGCAWTFNFGGLWLE